VRNLNRLAVAADDQIDTVHLQKVIETWRIKGLRERRPEALQARILRELKRGEEIMQELIGEVLA